MKHLLLLSILIIPFYKVTAQRIIFSDSKNRWSGYHYLALPPEVYRYNCGYYPQDTIIGGFSYRRLYCGDGIIDYGPLGIREDQAAGRIYCRFLLPYAPLGQNTLTDTAEHLFFDYSLKAGDTFRVNYGNHSSAHVVSKLDTVSLGAVPYRSWLMVSTTGRYPGNLAYAFVEGIGPLAAAFAPICNWKFEDYYELTCFTASNWRPTLTPAIGRFDNYASCSYWPVNIEIATASGLPTIVPNPGNAESILRIPADWNECEIDVRDGLGRLVASYQVLGGVTFSIGRMVVAPGLYHYILRSKSRGYQHAGKFRCQ